MQLETDISADVIAAVAAVPTLSAEYLVISQTGNIPSSEPGMKERITFIHPQDNTFDPSQLSVNKHSVQIKGLKAAREERLTFSWHELPQDCYEFLPSLKDLVIYVRNKFCSSFDSRCLKEAYRLSEVQYLDIDYDSHSRVLILTSFNHESPRSESWDERIQLDESSAKMEVGILSGEKAGSQDEISLEGILTVVGENKKPSPTRFSFPSRHHQSKSTFSTAFPPLTGLHPTLRLTLSSSSTSPPAPACALYTLLTLPSFLFVDKYQLSSPNLLTSKNLRALRNISGGTDLEAPDWVVQKWGSTLLVELAAPPAPSSDPSKAKKKDMAWHADIPLHLRYLLPALGGIANVDVPWPVVFWACPARMETNLDGNPFDRIDLGYDSLFDRQTVFHHLQPRPVGSAASLVELLQVPVMDLEGTRWVESGTVGVMMLGAVWIIWKLLKIIQGDWRSGVKVVQGKKKQ
ncbi:MAG: hypothetical protein Q9202_000440 [Teloschistes flavicans]